MARFVRISIFWLLLAGLLLPGFGQEKKKPNVSFGKVQQLEIDLVSVPDSVGSGGKPVPAGADPRLSQEGKWLRIDVPFATEKKITPEIKFRFYLEGYEGEESEGGAAKTEKRFVVLTGEVTYRDVPKGAVHLAGMFLPPASVARFSGVLPNGENNWANRQLNLRVEAEEGGSPVDPPFDLQAANDRVISGRGGSKDPDWHRAADGREIPGALLPVTATPFWPKDYRRYPQIQKP